MDVHITVDDKKQLKLKNVTVQEAIANYLFAITVKINMDENPANALVSVGELTKIYVSCLEQAKNYI